MAYITLRKLKKEYTMGEIKIKALDGVTFDIDYGKLTVILGPSGAGKTTVLNILGGMDSCDSGDVIVDSENVAQYNNKKLVLYRRYDIGFVFQFYNLVQNLTALENVELASQICKNPLDPATCLERVGLKNRLKNFPAQLSGGEQQRVAIARAIAKNPKLLLCDEPTGALDSKTGRKVLELLQEMVTKYQMTTIIITHNAEIAKIADKVIHMKNGKVKKVTINESPLAIKELDW